MFRPDLVQLLKQELIEALPEVRVEIVRHTGSRWERYQQVELALGGVRIFVFNEKGFYEVTFEAAADTIQFSAQSVLPRLGCDLPRMASRDATEVVEHLRELLARYSDDLISLFARESYEAFKTAVLKRRAR